MLKINRVSKGSYRATVNGRQVAIFKSESRNRWFAQDSETQATLASGKLLGDVRALLASVNAREHTVEPATVKPVVDDNRVQYREIRDRADYMHGLARREFDLAVAPHVADKNDSAQWLAAAIELELPCPSCLGTPGIYTHPGAPNASGGTCYRCRGKGTQNARDRKRNGFYDESCRTRK